MYDGVVMAGGRKATGRIKRSVTIAKHLLEFIESEADANGIDRNDQINMMLREAMEVIVARRSVGSLFQDEPSEADKQESTG